MPFFFIYQIIIKPINAKISPPDLNWLAFTSFALSKILFIFDGNKAYKIPSINKKRPKAMINSFIVKDYSVLGFIFPKNLKNSLSGESIKDVSPPIRDFSYACIAL